MTPRVRRYIAEAAAKHEVTAAQILDRSILGGNVMEARREVYLRLHRDGFSNCAIGRWMNRHPSSVWHSVRKAAV